MNLTKDNVRTSYLKGVNNLVGKGIVTQKMEYLIHRVKLTDRMSPSDMYYSLTKGLIDGMSSAKCNLSDELKRGFAEDLAVRTWEASGFPETIDFYTSKKVESNEHKLYNSNWIPYIVSGCLIDTIGERESAICMLKSPDLMGQLLAGIPYGNSTLLQYLNSTIPSAIEEFHGNRVSYLNPESKTVDCCMAISDCASQLSLPAERLKKQKVLSKIRKFMGKENEGKEL